MTRNMRVTKLGKHQIGDDASVKITETSGHSLNERRLAEIIVVFRYVEKKRHGRIEVPLTQTSIVPIRISLAARYRC